MKVGIERLKEKRAEIDARIRSEERRDHQKRRKLETRAKIVIGGLVLTDFGRSVMLPSAVEEAITNALSYYNENDRKFSKQRSDLLLALKYIKR